MKIVLSRKGFDSRTGGGASPVLPDGRMISLPIPETHPSCNETRYADLRVDDASYLALLRDLGYRGLDERSVAHLDPDLREAVREREPGWRGMAGQVGAAAGHLSRQGVAAGDLFLFWGLFRHTERDASGHVRFSPARPLRFHAFYGYLEVAAVLDASRDNCSFAPSFPHFAARDRGRPNLVFVARETLSRNPSLPGFGVFRWSEQLRLTGAGEARVTSWNLPSCFDPSTGVVLTYNREATRWTLAGERTSLTAASQGQEFVCEATAEIEEWAYGMVSGQAE